MSSPETPKKQPTTFVDHVTEFGTAGLKNDEMLKQLATLSKEVTDLSKELPSAMNTPKREQLLQTCNAMLSELDRQIAIDNKEKNFLPGSASDNTDVLKIHAGLVTLKETLEKAQGPKLSVQGVAARTTGAAGAGVLNAVDAARTAEIDPKTKLLIGGGIGVAALAWILTAKTSESRVARFFGTVLGGLGITAIAGMLLGREGREKIEKLNLEKKLSIPTIAAAAA